MNEELRPTPIDDIPPSPESMNESTTSQGPVSGIHWYDTGFRKPEKEYKKPVTEMLKENNIEIRFLSIGCVIRVGCKEIAFEDRDKAMVELMDYVRDPHTATKKWMKRFDE